VPNEKVGDMLGGLDRGDNTNDVDDSQQKKESNTQARRGGFKEKKWQCDSVNEKR
jgi:hypothetical protein